MAEMLTCSQDGEATRLTCAGCGDGICPRCMVRTPVGLKCQACTGVATGTGGRRLPTGAVVLLVAAASMLGVLAAGLVRRGDGARPAAAPSSTVDSGTQPGMGEEAHEGGLSFVVTRFDCQPTQTDASGAIRTPQGRFCSLGLVVKNVGDRPEGFSGIFQGLVDGQGRRFGPDDKATQALPENQVRDFLLQQINPGNEIRGVLVYDLPVGVEPAQALPKRTPRSSGVTIRLA